MWRRRSWAATIVAMNASSARSEKLSLASDPHSPELARRFLRRTLLAWDAEALEATAALVLSELVTNAVLHAGTDIEVSITLGDDALRLEVADRSTGRPRLRRYGLDATTGRGLALVAAMSSAWGVTPRLDGKGVWCELAYHSSTPAKPTSDPAASSTTTTDRTRPSGRSASGAKRRPTPGSSGPSAETYRHIAA